MVPIYSISTWLNLIQSPLKYGFEPIREIYEAFVLYTFFSLLTKYLGGERNIIISTRGRTPKDHIMWPLKYVLGKVDISDPYTFLWIKRAILQYTWLKPILLILIAFMQVIGIYHDNQISLTSGYVWIQLAYNATVTISLYALALFWYCLKTDLHPYNPMMKFLSIKIIIFFSYWQTVVLAILVFLGWVGNGYSATLIQNSLMNIELIGFAIFHYYGFSYKEYLIDDCARMPIFTALRDTVGLVDLIIDFKVTFNGSGYDYRKFDTVESIILDHPDSGARMSKIVNGLRYVDGGKDKYWLPSSASKRAAKPHLFNLTPKSRYNSYGSIQDNSDDEDIDGYGIEDNTSINGSIGTSIHYADLDPLMEDLYELGKQQKFGDFNNPVMSH